MFWKNFRELCDKKKKSPNAVAEELKLSSGSVTAWKNGSQPREGTLIKIADYFGVTVEELTRENVPNVKVAFYNADKLNDRQRKIVQSLIDKIIEEEENEETV